MDQVRTVTERVSGRAGEWERDRVAWNTPRKPETGSARPQSFEGLEGTTPLGGDAPSPEELDSTEGTADGYP
jgi:hypothetical protein